MKRILGMALLTASTLALGCAQTSEERQVDAEVKAEAPARGQGTLATRGANLFVNAPNLTDEQKEKLLKIHGETYQKVAKIRDELTQTKTTLFKSLVNEKTSSKELNILKSKIMKLDKERLNIMLKAFDDVQKIVGKSGMDENTLKHFIDMDRMRQ